MKREVVKVECRCRDCQYAELNVYDGYPREVVCRKDHGDNSVRRDIDDFCSRGKNYKGDYFDE